MEYYDVLKRRQKYKKLPYFEIGHKDNMAIL